MSIQLYNTLTRQKEVFEPIEKGEVKMYVCGPTVYNYIHIGNARPIIVFDTVRRYFEYRGYHVKFVSNFTDVDDKLIRVADELKVTVPEVADRFIKAYEEDTAALGVEPADVHPRVTENMPEIIALIATLIDKGYAYESEGDVYYRTRKFENYGALSQQSLHDLKVGARVEEDTAKQEPLDFVLWKAAKPGEISWESAWGLGRPGWHIECSAMAEKYLGKTIDIHAGGQDLQFPHHENEIAQSEAAHDQTFARYWMHNGYMNIDDTKMSKSLGNFITVHEMLKEHDPVAFRFFMLSVHYRNPINYSPALLADAQNGLERLRTAYFNVKHRLSVAVDNEPSDADAWYEQLNDVQRDFEREMDDDFNTANAITTLYDLAKKANIYVAKNHVGFGILESFMHAFEKYFAILGLTLATAKTSTADQLSDEEIEQLIEERDLARNERRFDRSDEIRDLFKGQQIILEDTPQGTRWRRG